jgi:uncharacterized membrane protein YfcA
MDAAFLCFFAFLAGFVDSVVGGGGLIQLPALLLALPGQPVPVMGTNKFAAICGTSVAAIQYARRVSVHWPVLAPAAISALIFSNLGARAFARLHPASLEPIILFLLVAVAIYTFWKKDFGHLHAPRLSPKKAVALAILTGVVIGFYDGFFGPGTGSFLIFIFIGIFGFDFLNASAHAKFVNFTTNFAAVAYFGWTGNILFKYAIPMAAFNILGSVIGTRTAILKGNRFVRYFFLVVVSGMILRFAWRIFSPS